ncbi:MAG: aminodeoxychorismate/anthranilate synthase component II [Polyangia bacterium]
MLLLVDNHDSFTFNLAQYLGELGADVRVMFADAIDVARVRSLAPSHIVLSPGPGHPADAGCCEALVRELDVPLLGVCLGHQAIAEALGGQVRRASPVHGKVQPITHDGTGLFEGLHSPLLATRYHSLVVDVLPPELAACAWSEEGHVMALRHVSRPLFGVQFHPESVGTPDGKALLRRFLAT